MDAEDVSRFVSLTNCPADQAQFYLEANNGNFDGAVAMFYEQTTVSSPRVSRVRDPSIPPRPTRGPTLGNPRRRGLAALLQLPISVLSTALNVVNTAAHISFSILNALGTRLLPPNVMNAIRALFAERFASANGDGGPQWLHCSWVDATSRAHASYKFLFVYLHCPSHQDAARFCRMTLCDPELVSYVDRTFLCWGGDVRSADAYQLSTSLRVTRYPYVCLLALSGASLRLVTYCEGMASASQLIQVFSTAQEQHSGVLVAQRAAAEELDWSRRLREEQDAEYQRSLEVDRERERAAAASRQQAEEQRSRAEAAARQQREEEERRAREEAEAAAAVAQRRRTRRQSLPEEPPLGGEGVCTVRVRLPDGSNAQRRFESTAPLRVVADFVESLEEMPHLRFHLVNTFPRKEYGQSDMQESLESLGLAPSAALFVVPVTD